MHYIYMSWWNIVECNDIYRIFINIWASTREDLSSGFPKKVNSKPGSLLSKQTIALLYFLENEWQRCLSDCADVQPGLICGFVVHMQQNQVFSGQSRPNHVCNDIYTRKLNKRRIMQRLSPNTGLWKYHARLVRPGPISFRTS